MIVHKAPYQTQPQDEPSKIGAALNGTPIHALTFTAKELEKLAQMETLEWLQFQEWLRHEITTRLVAPIEDPSASGPTVITHCHIRASLHHNPKSVSYVSCTRGMILYLPEELATVFTVREAYDLRQAAETPKSVKWERVPVLDPEKIAKSENDQEKKLVLARHGLSTN